MHACTLHVLMVAVAGISGDHPYSSYKRIDFVVIYLRSGHGLNAICFITLLSILHNFKFNDGMYHGNVFPCMYTACTMNVR